MAENLPQFWPEYWHEILKSLLNRHPEADRPTTHLLGGPLEAGDDRVLDLVEVLHSLGAVDEDVGSLGVGAEAPDLPRLGDVVLVLVGQVPAADLEVVAGVDLAL